MAWAPDMLLSEYSLFEWIKCAPNCVSLSPSEMQGQEEPVLDLLTMACLGWCQLGQENIWIIQAFVFFYLFSY